MQSGHTVLLVEDDAVTRELLALLLSEDGWQVGHAVSGEAALAWLDQQVLLPSLVLCDQKLPGLQGSALAETLRNAIERTGQIRPVLLAMTAARTAAPADGYDGLLLKPFSAEQVRVAYDTVLLGHNDYTQPEILTAAYELAGLPIIDEAVFANLQKSMGNDRLQELYAFALADAADRMRRMNEALKTDDLECLTREAHALKGAAGMIGASRVARLAATLEEDSADFSASQIGSDRAGTLVMLSTALDDIQLMLEALFPMHAASLPQDTP